MPRVPVNFHIEGSSSSSSRRRVLFDTNGARNLLKEEPTGNAQNKTLLRQRLAAAVDRVFGYRLDGKRETLFASRPRMTNEGEILPDT
jgi:hypothetical protein